MNPVPHLSKIVIYPIKSLDGIEVEKIGFSSSGALYMDRRFAFFTGSGKTVNAKKYPTIHKIRASFDLEKRKVTVKVDGYEETFLLEEGNPQFEAWASDFFHEKVFLRENPDCGFPDDTERGGPTLVSLESLKAVQEWFPQLSLENIRRRFRCNLEVSETPFPFWEDTLLKKVDFPSSFYLDETEFHALKVCARCPVPARDPDSGEMLTGFQKKFIGQRKALLPSTVKTTQFPHFYMLTINTRVPNPKDATLNLDDPLRLPR